MTRFQRLCLGDLDETPGVGRIGPFQLVDPVGSGSMGSVWRARHDGQNVEVALKVIASRRSGERQFQRAFRQEVRSMAGLNHPFVVEILDFGKIGEADEISGPFEVEVGSPYLAMEFAWGGNLGEWLQGGEVSWEAIEIVLFALLDAMAHSHARGVLHRDIKPQNVLITDSSSEAGVGIRLSDFGLAYALRSPQEVADWHHAAGTPEYMAPELVVGNWRQYGPSTDLYALGCLAFELLEGKPPFRGKNIVQIARAQLEAPPPRLSTEISVPPGVERWLSTMLAKDAGKRFGSAADAAVVLRQICGAPDGDAMARGWAQLSRALQRTGPDDSEQVAAEHSLEVILTREEIENTEIWSGERQVDRQIPRCWRRRQQWIPRVRLSDTGKGLFRLRRLPVVGRGEEREQLWGSLRATFREGKPRGVAVMGAAGVGKDFLAQWLCDRAGELDVAQSFRFHASRGEGLRSPLAQMVEQSFALKGLTRGEIEGVLQELLISCGATDPYEWESITELLHPRSEEDPLPSIQFGSPRARLMAYLRFFERLTSQGPVIVWMRDLLASPEGLRWARLMLDRVESSAPILVVMTIGPEFEGACAEDAKVMLQELLALERVEGMELSPLEEPVILDLVQRALFLDPEVAYEVARNSGGNPMRALEMVGNWVDQGLLEATDRGYALMGREGPTISSVGDAFWGEVIDRLAGDSAGDEAALELAALLGDTFYFDTWEMAVRDAGWELSSALVERLLERRYLVERGNQVEFVQNLLREALVARARSSGRLLSHSRSVVCALEQSGDRELLVDERAGILLLDAGQVMEGTERLEGAVQRRAMLREYHATIYLASRSEAALRGVDDEHAKRRRGRLLVALSKGWAGVGRHDRSLEFGELAKTIAERLGDKELLGQALLRCASANLVIGERGKAWDLGERAIPYLEGLPKDYISACLTLAGIALRNREFTIFEEFQGKAEQALAKANFPAQSSQAAFTRFHYRMLIGDEIDPREVEQMLEICRRHRLNTGMMRFANMRAELARKQGDFEIAQTWYREAIRLGTRIDPDRAVPAQINLALIEIANGSLKSGAWLAERILQNLRRTRRPLMNLYCKAVMLPHRVAAGRWEQVEELVGEINELLDEAGIGGDADLEDCLRVAVSQLGEPPAQATLRERLEEILRRVKVG